MVVVAVHIFPSGFTPMSTLMKATPVGGELGEASARIWVVMAKVIERNRRILPAKTYGSVLHSELAEFTPASLKEVRVMVGGGDFVLTCIVGCDLDIARGPLDAADLPHVGVNEHYVGYLENELGVDVNTDRGV